MDKKTLVLEIVLTGSEIILEMLEMLDNNAKKFKTNRLA